jgi:hypothetical protein
MKSKFDQRHTRRGIARSPTHRQDLDRWQTIRAGWSISVHGQLGREKMGSLSIVLHCLASSLESFHQ